MSANAHKRPRPVALAYHGVDAVPLRDDGAGLFTAPAALRRHIGLLRRRGYRLVTFGELAARAAAGEGAGLAALTFDDGLADTLTVLAPLLAEVGATATVFAVSGWLGGEHPDAPGAPLLDAPQLRALHAAGVEIGAHSATHPDLTTLPFAAARAELEDSRRALEAILDAPVTSAAYPYGRANSETVSACAAAGFRAACRTGAAGSPHTPLDFPREDMVNGSTLLGLRLKLAGAYEPLLRRAPARGLRGVKRRAQRALDR